MEVYFIRHGQTNGNLAGRYQHEKTQLNEAGVKQVKNIVKKVQDLKPTRLITSTQLRAVETARLLSEGSDLVPETSVEFEELRIPSRFVGSRFFGLTTFFFASYWFFGRLVIGGESYRQFFARIKRAQKILEDLPEGERVVVVSHSVFINIFIEHLCLDKKMSIKQAFKSFVRILNLQNTAIVHLHYDRGLNICNWITVED